MPSWLSFNPLTGRFSGTAPSASALQSIDVRVTATDSTQGSVSDTFTLKMRAPTAALFAAYDPVHGTELWVTDGTPGGTSLLQDIRTGAADGVPQGFTPVGANKVVFSAEDAANGIELWVTDIGTSAGTALLKDLWTGSASGTPHSGEPYGFTPAGGNKALFSADYGASGRELWVTDGTAAGTVVLKDIQTGGVGSAPEGFEAPGNGKVLFAAETTSAGRELWATDGTAAGTLQLKDISPGAIGSSPEGLTALGNGKAVFTADDGLNGRELWVTDGTGAGTVLLSDVFLGWDSSTPYALTLLAPERLCSSPTTDQRHRVVGHQRHRTRDHPGEEHRCRRRVGRAVQHHAAGRWPRAVHRELGDELWITNGTTAGTTLLKDMVGGVDYGHAPYSLTPLANGKVLFSGDDGPSGDDGNSGRELWVTDGTANGTVLLADLFAGPGSSSPDGFSVLANGKVVFSADDGVNGTELWITDGNLGETQLLEQHRRRRRTVLSRRHQCGDLQPLARWSGDRRAASRHRGPAYTISAAASSRAGTFTDPDGDALFIIGLPTADRGSVAANANGSFTITPALNYHGAVGLSYIVTDGLGSSIPGSQSFTLAPANDAPTGSASAVLAAGTEDDSYTVTAAALLQGFSDIEGDTLSVSGLLANQGSVTNNNDGTYTVTPTANYNGSVATHVQRHRRQRWRYRCRP